MIIKDQAVFNWLEANADLLKIHGWFSRPTEGVHEDILLLLMKEIDSYRKNVISLECELNHCYNKCDRWRAAENSLLKAAQDVTWFDWSDCDEDACASIARLRQVISAVEHRASTPTTPPAGGRDGAV